MSQNISGNELKRLRTLRIEAGMSQEQLANKANVSKSMIKKLESGERSLNKVSLETIFKFAVIFEVPMEYFVETSEINLNIKYIDYFLDVMDEISRCYGVSHKKGKYYIPYDERKDPYEELEKIYKKEYEEAMEMTKDEP